jgi:hypothetical protein
MGRVREEGGGRGRKGEGGGREGRRGRGVLDSVFGMPLSYVVKVPS